MSEATSESVPAPLPRSSTRSPAEGERVDDAGEGLEDGLGDAVELGWVAEIARPLATGGEDEVLRGLLRDGRVGLPDLGLQHADVEAGVEGHR
jgi:hypothetical protein